MAATKGDFIVRRNDTKTDKMPNAGTDVDAEWDGAVYSNGTSITYSSGTFTLNSGKYIICHSEWLDNSPNLSRTEIQARLIIGGSETLVAAGHTAADSGAAGALTANLGGMGILDIASDSTSLLTRYYRTDSLTPESSFQLKRVPDKAGGVCIVAIDPAWSYGRYHTNADVDAPTSSGFTTIAFDINDQQDTGFSNSSGAVTLTDAGRYLVFFSVLIDAADDNTASFMSRLTLDDTEVQGTRVTAFMRGASGCRDCVLSYGGVVKVLANDILKVEVFKDLGTSGGSTLANSNLQILKLPSGNKTCIVEATSGDINPDSETLFTWDTVPQIDTDTFTHSAGGTVITVDATGFYLFFCTQCQLGDGTIREYPTGKFGLEASTTNAIAGDGSYTRGSGGDDSGLSFGAMYDISATDTIGVYNQKGGLTDAHTCDHGAFSAVRLDDILPPGVRRVFVT